MPVTIQDHESLLLSSQYPTISNKPAPCMSYSNRDGGHKFLRASVTPSLLPLTLSPKTGSIVERVKLLTCRVGEENTMTDRERSPSLERRAFLGAATSAGVASLLAPRTA